MLTLLTTDGVLAHPGYFFDFPRESFVIVSLLVTEAAFAAGIERLFARAGNGISSGPIRSEPPVVESRCSPSSRAHER
jgi:hypothetical protein